MKALVLERGGFRLNRETPLPSKVKGDILIRVRLAGICRTDLELEKGYMGFEGIPGHEFMGVIEEDDGEGLVGRRAVSEINCVCSNCCYCRDGLREHCPKRTVIGIERRDGAFAEFIRVPGENVHPLPEDLPDRAAVLIEPLAAAMKAVEDGDIRSCHKVAILGDGSLGLMVSMAARLTDCDLVLIGKHPNKMGVAKSAGIETLPSDGITGSQNSTFDRVIDCTGSPGGLHRALELIRPQGRIIMKTTTAEKVVVALSSLVVNEVTLIGSRCGSFDRAIEVLTRGAIDPDPLISGVYSLERWREAFAKAKERESLKVLFEMGA